MTSPRNSSGVTTSTAKIGSSRTGLARFAASLKAGEPATLEANPEAAKAWALPSAASDPHVDPRVAGLDAVLERLFDALLDRGDVLGGHVPALDLVDELEAVA